MDPLALDFSFWQSRLFGWGGGLAVALLVAGLAHLGKARSAAIGVMSVPLWFTFLGIVESIAPLVRGGTVLGALTRPELSGIYTRALLSNLGYLGFGLLLWASEGDIRRAFRLRVVDLARSAREMGLDVGTSEARSAFLGWLGFPLLLAVAFAVTYVGNLSSTLSNGDESAYFSNMTPYHAVAISLAAGFGEELLYRGFLQTGLRRLGLPVVAAVMVQAVVFGLAHAGYGNFLHVLSPLLFGIATGLVAWRFGIWASIVLHVLVDVYAFAYDAARAVPWWDDMLLSLLYANVIVSAVWAVRELVRWRQRERGTGLQGVA